MAYKGQQKIAALTAYTAPFARLLDDALDMILIGDSTAMVGYGLPNTLSITVDQLAAHAAAVVRSTSHACIIVDMPFGSYQESPQQAFVNRSEEHTSELQSLMHISYAVFCLKKKHK